jgi:poly-gamma-glutamate synthesis protein (capsule biosynthesis protein)
VRARLGLAAVAAIIQLLASSGGAGAAEPGQVTLVFVGDVMLADGPGRTIEAGQDPLARVAPLLAGADLAVANLECPVSLRGAAVDKPWTFRAHPRVVQVLARHFQAVSLANNHSGDYGPDALLDTLEALDRGGVAHFGAGKDLSEAHAPLIIERNGLKLALIGCEEFKPRAFEAGTHTPGVAWCEDQQLLHDLAVARAAGADLVIPYLHWGWEGEPQPCQRQRDLAHLLIDAGADAVIGGHPHIVQPAELYRGRLILYSLGNFVFDGFPEGPGRLGWALRLTLSPQGLVAWRTCQVSLDPAGTPAPAKCADGSDGSAP